MLEFSRRPTPIKAGLAKQGGFTLFELIVVMVLLGLIGVTVLPNLPGLGAALSRNQELASVKLQITQLAGRSFADAQSYYIGSPDRESQFLPSSEVRLLTVPLPPPEAALPAPLNLPSGWDISVEQPIYFFRTGFCSGGELLILQGVRTSQYRLNGPDCDELIDAN